MNIIVKKVAPALIGLIIELGPEEAEFLHRLLGGISMSESQSLVKSYLVASKIAKADGVFHLYRAIHETLMS